MGSDLRGTIADAAALARSLLGQLGPLVWALHAAGGAVIPAALCLDHEPEEWVAIGTDEPPQRRELRRGEVVKALRELRAGRGTERPELFTSKGYRDAINRSIVVYAVAVVDQFLDDAGREVLSAGGASVGSWRDSLQSKCKSLCSAGVSLYGCPHYAEAAWLALVRHKIVHANAQVDPKLLSQVASLEKESGRHLGFRLSADGSSVVWSPSADGGLRECWKCKRISLAVDEVLLPLLRDAQAFVAEVEAALLATPAATGAERSGPAGAGR